MAGISDNEKSHSPSSEHYSEGFNEKDVIDKQVEDSGKREATAHATGGMVPPADLTFTQAEEDQVHRKLGYRLLPFVWVLYSLAVLDRSNLGNAKLAGLEEDIDLSGWRYNWLGTTFYIACTFNSSFSSSLIARLIPPRYCFPMDLDGLEEVSTSHLLHHRRLFLGVCRNDSGFHHHLGRFDGMSLLPGSF